MLARGILSHVCDQHNFEVRPSARAPRPARPPHAQPNAIVRLQDKFLFYRFNAEVSARWLCLERSPKLCAVVQAEWDMRRPHAAVSNASKDPFLQGLSLCAYLHVFRRQFDRRWAPVQWPSRGGE